LSAGRSTLDRIIDGVFIIAMTGVAILAVFGHRGLAPCAGLMALAVALRGRTWKAGFGLLSLRRMTAQPLSIAFAAALGFSVWVALTVFWSPVRGAEWLGLTVLVSILSAGALVFEAQRASRRRADFFAALFTAAVSAGAAALMFEGLSGGYLRGILPPEDLSPLRWKDLTALGRGVTAIAPLAFPAAIMLRRMSGSWLIAFSPVFAIFLAAASFSIFANVASIAAGALACLAGLARPRLSLKFWSAIILLSLIAVPFAASMIPADATHNGAFGFLPASWSHRLVIWKAAAQASFGSCFPLGCGADYARALSENGAMTDIKGWPVPVPVMPVHPHNLFLQIWLELGLPGVALFAIALIAGAGALLRSDIDRMTSAAVAAVATVSLISVMFEASLWQVWRLAVFALAAFGCAVSYSINKS